MSIHIPTAKEIACRVGQMLVTLRLFPSFKRFELGMAGHDGWVVDAAIRQGKITRLEDGTLVINNQPIFIVEAPQVKAAPPQAASTTEKSHTPIITSDAPELIGCELKNSDRAHRDNYYFFIGSKQAIEGCAETLIDAGVYVKPKANGKNGKWKILVPLWVTGTVEPANIFQMEETYVS